MGCVIVIEPPIVVDENGDIEVYKNVAEAALDLEAIDVLNNEFVIFDSRGRLLDAVATSETSPVRIREPDDVQLKPEMLRARLASFIARVGSRRLGFTHETLAAARLPALISALLNLKYGNKERLR
jgi:hypothetical protein